MHIFSNVPGKEVSGNIFFKIHNLGYKGLKEDSVIGKFHFHKFCSYKVDKLFKTLK